MREREKGFGDYKIEKIVFIPPNISYSRNIIGVSTFNGEMTLTYHGVWDKREDEKRFFEKGIQNLTGNGCGGS